MKKIYLCMLIVAFCSCMVHAQTLHRYVVEVETVPDKREYKAEKLINGNVRLEPQGPRKTVKYYEILSRTPLTAKQCQDSIRLGKARQISKPVRKYRHRKNVTLEGWDGVNPADVEPTEYDLNYEDPDLYDFIAD